MKRQIKSYFEINIRLILLIAALSVTGCTKKFEDINTDPSRLTSLTPENVKSLFPGALKNGLTSGPAGAQQTGQNLFADQYAQYFAGTATYFQSHRYVIVQDWIQTQWIGVYVSTIPSLQIILDQTKSPETAALNAIARVWKVFALHRTTDYYGPIPYSKIGSTDKTIAYDRQRDIYYDFFKELSEASATLKNNLGLPSYGDKDLIYGGNNLLWFKFANTLRLRLALRISNVEPDKAKQEAEAAVADGVLTDVGESALFKCSPVNSNGLNWISDWDEFRMSTTMESLLKGYNDPRLSEYFSPAKATGEYRGVRNGMLPAEQVITENSPSHASNVGPRYQVGLKDVTPEAVMYAAEAYFLRAEGALNGWNMGGTAKDLYAKGIEMSMRQFGITDETVIDNYINGETLPIAPGGYFNTPALTDIPVKFSSDPEKQREQILTQKWLALYPDGYEAWAEMRRSGYPKFYPLIHSENPDMPADQMIRRIVFTTYDRDRNGPAVDSAILLLNGPDKVSTRLWWDTH
jgi:hypothetical protein